MRVVLADLNGLDGFVSKDTIVGGYGSRLTPFSRVTAVIAKMKRRFHDVLSIQMAYLAALADRAGHQVVFTRGELVDGDVAVVLSSLVDYRHEAAWATAMRARGVTVGFVGLAASRLPELFESAADFVVIGEPEEAIGRLFAGERLTGRVTSHEVTDLDSLPFPRWDLLEQRPHMVRLPGFSRPLRGGIPLLASRSCPEFCTYCPHRILSTYRARSVASIADELEQLCERFPRPYVIFRDPLFTQDRERCLALADEIQARGLRFRFECETRLDRLDAVLIERLHAVGLRTMSFGVESSSETILRKVAPADSTGSSACGHRAVPPARDRHCRVLRDRLPARRLGIDRHDDRVLGRAGLDLCTVQGAHALPRHGAVEADEAPGVRDGLAEIRRIHSDLHPSDAERR
jgi:hypothetical protein